MKIKTMDLILGIVGVMLVVFTVTMIIIFIRCGSIPDTLCTCFFAAVGTECGAMGWIKTTKTRYQERQWELEDREDARKQAPDDNMEG